MMNKNILFQSYDRDALNIIFEKRNAWFKKYLNIELVPFQQELSNSLITYFLDENGGRIYTKSSRQTGKSTVVIGTMVFIGTFLKEILPKYADNKKMSFGLSVPRLDQATQNFDQAKYIIDLLKEDSIIEKPEKENAGMLSLKNGFTIYVFSLADGTKNQSKTLALSVVDEAQDINFNKYKKEIEPMLSTTNGPQAFIGVGCYEDNEFYRVMNGKLKYNNSKIVFNDYYRAVKEREDLFNLNGDLNLLQYQRFCDNLDKTSTSWKTEFLLLDEVTKGTFITLEALQSLKEEYFPSYIPSKDEITYVGIDWAKSSDSTVITIINQNFKILNIFEMQGHLIDQEDFIVGTLMQYKPKLIFSDETGLGAGSTAYLQRIFGKRKVVGITFTTNSKHDMYSNLINYIQNVRYSSLFYQDIISKFETQFSKLVKTYTSTGKLKVNHPEGGHDDYPDSLALACLFTLINKPDNKLYDLSERERLQEDFEMSTISYDNFDLFYSSK